MTPEQFWATVGVGAADECWEWRGFRNEDRGGYGQLRHDGRQAWAHRIAWELSNGQDVPAGLYVRHACDNPPCCNPAHLSTGTQRDNMQDAKARGRMWFQRDHCKNGHELTEDNVRWITKRGKPSRQCLACAVAMRPIRTARARAKYRQVHNLGAESWRKP